MARPPVGRCSAAAVVALLLSSGCSGSSPRPGPAVDVRIASFDFPESDLLAQIYGQALEANGFRVRILSGLGSREIVEPALQQRRVDFVPEYVGSALNFFAGAGRATGNARSTYQKLAKRLGEVGITALSMAPAVDQNGVVVLRRTAERLRLRSISDLAPFARTLSFAGPPECANRALCLPGLRSTYGIRFASFHPATSRADIAAELLAGEVDVGMLETTSGYLTDQRLVLLRDNRALQPADNVVPVVGTAVLRHFGARLQDTIDEVSARLHTADLVAMNSQVQIRGASPRSVAREWLGRQHLPGQVHTGSS